MDRTRPGLIQRAFELARSGRLSTISQIDAALRAEKYDAVPSQLSGGGIRTELRAIMRARRTAAEGRRQDNRASDEGGARAPSNSGSPLKV